MNRKPAKSDTKAKSALNKPARKSAAGGAERVIRCQWASPGNDAYVSYHDCEWGVPVHDDAKLFEFVLLEGAQAGLSWTTILNKRGGYRKAFADFDVSKVARFTEKKIERLVASANIVRNRLKVKAAVSNARQFLEIQAEFGSFDVYSWQFVNGKPIQNQWKSMKQVPVTTPESDAFSKDMKRRGFKFFGSTICYAYMQAVGMVNDHTIDCFRHREVTLAR